MYINEALLNSNSIDDPIKHLHKILESIFYTEKEVKRNFELLPLVQSLSVMNIFCQKYNLPSIKLSKENTTYLSALVNEFTDFYKDFLISNQSIYNHYFDIEKYSFNDDEFKTIQCNINFLRNEITKSTLFSEEHKTRLLAKLEKLQAELHKTMSSFDKTQGYLLSIARTLGQMGKEAKPMFDRVNETLKIIFKVEDQGDSITISENQIGYEEILQVEVIKEK